MIVLTPAQPGDADESLRAQPAIGDVVLERTLQPAATLGELTPNPPEAPQRTREAELELRVAGGAPRKRGAEVVLLGAELREPVALARAASSRTVSSIVKREPASPSTRLSKL